MTLGDHETRWDRMIELLGPFHAQALATAHRLARSADDGDDLYQETLRRAFDKLPTLRDPERFRSWFFAVLLSVHRSRSRRSFWKRFASWDSMYSRGHDAPGADGRRDEEIRSGAERASVALSTLSAAEREAVVLFHLEGFTLEEIARLQNASLSAVKTRLSRGRERLRAQYRKRGWVPSSAARTRQDRRERGGPEENPAASALLGAVPLAIQKESSRE